MGIEEVQIAVVQTPKMTASKYKIRLLGQDTSLGFQNFTDIDLIITCEQINIDQSQTELAYHYTVGDSAI